MTPDMRQILMINLLGSNECIVLSKRIVYENAFEVRGLATYIDQQEIKVLHLYVYLSKFLEGITIIRNKVKLKQSYSMKLF